MKKKYLFFVIILCFTFNISGQSAKIADPSNYLSDIKEEFKKEWPGNKTINLVFHGHSVPAGYFKTPVVNTLEAYPYQTLKELKEAYPFAEINIINTAIGGENSVEGAKRFEQDVLVHKPDVLFIDYALNDRPLGIDKAKEAWESMITKALKNNIKVILLTPTPDQRVNILEPGNILEKHTAMIRQLAEKYGVGLVDSYVIYHRIALSKENIADYMAQVNHPNAKGHLLIAKEIAKYFK
jgi:acyl-CoA thioesterase I